MSRTDPTRILVTHEGPVLVDGPITVPLGDGTEVTSERPRVALCTCRRSRCYPFCDTSHRERVRTSARADGGDPS